MPDNFTDSEERRLLDLSVPNTGTFLALYTVAPGLDGTGGTEVSGGAYARQAITCASAATDGSSVSFKSNTADIVFPVATADWGTVVAFGVVDAATGGTIRWRRVLTTQEQRQIKTGDRYTYATGIVVFQLT